MGEYSVTWTGWPEVEHGRQAGTSRLVAAVLLAAPVEFLANVLPGIDWDTGQAGICNRCFDSLKGSLGYCTRDVV